jgi:hypothetical protein
MNARIARALSVPLLLLAFADANAFSSGAPICEANDIVGSPMGFQVPVEAPIYLVRKQPYGYREGETITFGVYANGFWDNFNGVLLYVEDPDVDDGEGHPQKVGEFVGPPPPGYRFKDDCDESLADLVLTHDGGDDKPTPAEFAWTAPSQNLGTLRIRAIVLRAGKEFDFGHAPYKIFSIDLPYCDCLFIDGFD